MATNDSTETTTTDLIFEDPPPAAGGRGRGGPLSAWLGRLRDHPNQWVKYPEPVSSGVASAIRSGQKAGIVAGEFEAATRSIRDSKPLRCDLYARYIGEGGAS